MPELRSGARRSRRLNDLQHPAAQVNDQADNLLPPVQNKTRRRGGGGGGGRGRGANSTVVAKGTAAGTRQIGAGRGRGKLIDLDPEIPTAGALQIAAIGAAGGHNRVDGAADKNLGMEGGNGDKLMGVEEDANQTPIPDKICTWRCEAKSCSQVPRKMRYQGFTRRAHMRLQLIFRWDLIPFPEKECKPLTQVQGFNPSH